MQKEENLNAANRPLFLTDDRTTEYTERLNWVHGWTDECVKYLDEISKIDISHDAFHRQRLRYESTICLRSVDSNKRAGLLCQRPDF